jgi:FixJ family two-component response regulator
MVPSAPVIAIVDDDLSVRIATESLMRSLGYVACSFASAQDFLRSERLLETACLITDVQMPGMGGMELQQTLVSTGRAMPVIFITAFPEERVRRQAASAGAFGFLSKPFEGQAIIDCVEAALGHAG